MNGMSKKKKKNRCRRVEELFTAVLWKTHTHAGSTRHSYILYPGTAPGPQSNTHVLPYQILHRYILCKHASGTRICFKLADLAQIWLLMFEIWNLDNLSVPQVVRVSNQTVGPYILYRAHDLFSLILRTYVTYILLYIGYTTPFSFFVACPVLAARRAPAPTRPLDCFTIFRPKIIHAVFL